MKDQTSPVDLYIGRDIKEKGLYEAKHYPQTQELLIFQINEQHCKNAVATLKRDDFAKEIIKHFELSPYFHSINGIDDKDTHSKSDIILDVFKRARTR